MDIILQALQAAEWQDYTIIVDDAPDGTGGDYYTPDTWRRLSFEFVVR